MNIIRKIIDFLRRNWYAFAIALILLYFLFDRFYGGWLDCRITHFTGFHLLTPRDLVRDACREKLNPFTI